MTIIAPIHADLLDELCDELVEFDLHRHERDMLLAAFDAALDAEPAPEQIEEPTLEMEKCRALAKCIGLIHMRLEPSTTFFPTLDLRIAYRSSRFTHLGSHLHETYPTKADILDALRRARKELA